jgi:hypothetical protein
MSDHDQQSIEEIVQTRRDELRNLNSLAAATSVPSRQASLKELRLASDFVLNPDN